ncbi:hypothetical protein B7494_g396 [Chlorociboria aeruginascens]|nr:hypothetical protein B7494_g396 [Chlorociboria aeruginascens]
MDPDGSVSPKEEEKIEAARTPSPSPEQKQHDEKLAKILDACRWEDAEMLRALATSEGGFLSDNARQQAWPLLLGCGDIKTEPVKTNWRLLPEHRDEYQVRLDVDRSFIFYPNDQSPKELDRRKEELYDLIVEVLRRQPYLCYFQGYHDICQLLLLVLDPPNRASTVARLSILRIRDFMLPNLEPALAQLRLIPALLYAVNPKLYNHLPQTQPFFALSGTLTMYAHDIQEYGDIARLFDVLLAREAVFSVYMFAYIVLQRSEELFETPSDEPEMLHSILSKLPKPLDLENLISGTVKLFEKHPPESLSPWRSISQSSVLKTARWSSQTENQTLDDGEMYFSRQVKELDWAEKRKKVLGMVWKYRKPAGTVGVAVLVAVLSIMARRSWGPSGIFGAFWRQWMGYQGH